jgi:hypothetical protein
MKESTPLSQWLRQYRKDHRLLQRELALRLGVTKDSIGDLEQGLATISSGRRWLYFHQRGLTFPSSVLPPKAKAFVAGLEAADLPATIRKPAHLRAPGCGAEWQPGTLCASARKCSVKRCQYRPMGIEAANYADGIPLSFHRSLKLSEDMD